MSDDLARVTAERDALREAMLHLGALRWWEYSGPEMQDALEAAKLIQPSVATEDDPAGDYSEGDEVFVLTPLGRCLAASRETGQGPGRVGMGEG